MSREWSKIAKILFLLILPAAGVLYVLSVLWPSFFRIGFYAIVGLFVLQAALIYGYTVKAASRERTLAVPPVAGSPLPRTTFIVSAYLPNEISVVGATVSHILRNVTRPSAGIEVILVYNTSPEALFEDKLRTIKGRWPELILEHAQASSSKSENLNVALGKATGDMIVLLDADHLVAGDCIWRAWRWLEAGYDAVQGLCKVRNLSEGVVPSLVGIEFEVKYGVYDESRSAVFRTGFFGGSNGYWKAEAIKTLGFDRVILTEDIDVTLRGALAGFKFVHDKSIVSTELAPKALSNLWFQRKRWTQGWLQCLLKYQKDVWDTERLSPLQKISWTIMLTGGVVYDVVSFLFFPWVLVWWIRAGRISLPVDPYTVGAFLFMVLTIPLQMIVIFRNATPPRPPASHYLLYATLAWPYAVFKTVLQIVAIRDEWAGERAWTLSARH